MSVSTSAPSSLPSDCPSLNSVGAGRVSADGMTRLICLIGSILFCIAAKTPLLYEANQNTKFLHGMAKAFPERLGADWMTGTVDGLPLFSGFVFLVARYGSPIIFYLAEFGLLACLFWSCFYLVLRLAGGAARSICFQLGFAGILVLLIQANLRFSFVYGVAEQYLVGGYLQPSEFGVLFLASFALALGGFRNSALLTAAIPAVFHPGYAVLSMIMVASMICSDRLSQRNLMVKIVSVLLIVVPQMDLALRFAPTDYVSFQEAARILAFERIPQHSDPSRWLGGEAYAKLALTVIGIWLAPRGLLRNTLAIFLAWAVAGTLVVAITGAAGLALVAPLRASVIIVPASTVIVLARLGRLAFGRLPFPGWKVAASGALVLFAGLIAGKQAVAKFNMLRDRHVPPHIQFILDNHDPADVYLTDPSDAEFRLAAMSAQFVSWKTHPYLDRDVLEWRKRTTLAQKVFSDDGGKVALNCSALAELVRIYPVTHILVERREIPAGKMCGPLDVVFSSGDARIFKVDRALLK